MSFFSKLDIFQQPISFNLNNNVKLSTNFGKFMTIVVVSYALYALIRSNLVLKTNPIIKVENHRPLERPHIYFNTSNFTIALGIFQDNVGYISDPKIFKLNAELNFFDNEKNTYFSIQKNIFLCSEENYNNAGENFKQTNTSNLFCLDMNNETAHIYGALNEKKMQSLTLKLSRCQNSTENNFLCKSIEEQDNILQTSFLDVVLQNDLVDYSNLDFPIKNDVNKYYTNIDVNLSKSMNARVKHIIVESDKGFFFNEIEKKESYLVEDVIIDIITAKKDSSLVEVQLISHENETIHTRKYQHIPELLAEIGGILNILILTGLLIVNIELPYILTKGLSSDLYSYQTLDQEKEIKLERKKSLRQIKINDANKEKPLITILDVGAQLSSQTRQSKETEVKYEFSKMRSSSINKIKNKLSNTLIDRKKSLSSKKDKAKINIECIELMEEEAANLCSSRFQTKSNEFCPGIQIPPRPGDVEITSEHSPCASADKNNMMLRKSSSFGHLPKVEIDEEISKKKNMNSLMNMIKITTEIKKKQELSKFIDIVHFKKSFPISFWSYLSILFKCRKFRLQPKEKLFLLGEEQIEKDLDVFKIINLMNDVEKLKMILLNERQRYLFNLLKKPLITLKDEDSEIGQNNTILSSIKLKIKKDLVMSYYRDLVHNKYRSKIDERILNLLDQDILNFDKSESI